MADRRRYAMTNPGFPGPVEESHPGDPGSHEFAIPAERNPVRQRIPREDPVGLDLDAVDAMPPVGPLPEPRPAPPEDELLEELLPDDENDDNVPSVLAEPLLDDDNYDLPSVLAKPMPGGHGYEKFDGALGAPRPPSFEGLDLGPEPGSSRVARSERDAMNTGGSAPDAKRSGAMRAVSFTEPEPFGELPRLAPSAAPEADISEFDVSAPRTPPPLIDQSGAAIPEPAPEEEMLSRLKPDRPQFAAIRLELDYDEDDEPAPAPESQPQPDDDDELELSLPQLSNPPPGLELPSYEHEPAAVQSPVPPPEAPAAVEAPATDAAPKRFETQRLPSLNSIPVAQVTPPSDLPPAAAPERRAAPPALPKTTARVRDAAREEAALREQQALREEQARREQQALREEQARREQHALREEQARRDEAMRREQQALREEAARREEASRREEEARREKATHRERPARDVSPASITGTELVPGMEIANEAPRADNPLDFSALEGGGVEESEPPPAASSIAAQIQALEELEPLDDGLLSASVARTSTDSGLPWPTGETPRMEDVLVDELEAIAIADFGEVPKNLFWTPFYAWRVLVRQRALNAESDALELAIKDAEAERDRVLVQLVEQMRTVVERDPRLRKIFARVKHLEGTSSTSTAALEQAHKNYRERAEEVNQENQRLKAIETKAQEVLRASYQELALRTKAFKQAETVYNRLRVEAHTRQQQDAKSQAEGRAPQHTQRLAELHGLIERAKAPVLAAREPVQTAEKQVLAMESRVAEIRRQRDAVRKELVSLDRTYSEQFDVRRASISADERERLKALSDAGRTLLKCRGQIDVDEELLDELRSADATVEQAVIDHRTNLEAADTYDAKAFKHGLIAAGVFALVMLILILKLFFAPSYSDFDDEIYKSQAASVTTPRLC